MSDPSLSPSSNVDDPIDAEFEPAQRTESSGLPARAGPGWLAYLVLATICLGVSVYGAGLIPGFKPGSSDLAALQSEITTIQAAEATQPTQAAALATDIAALKSRADNLQADRTRAVTDIRGLREEIEALRADISSLQRARIASIAEPSEEDAETPDRPDLSVRRYVGFLGAQLPRDDEAAGSTWRRIRDDGIRQPADRAFLAIDLRQPGRAGR